LQEYPIGMNRWFRLRSNCRESGVLNKVGFLSMIYFYDFGTGFVINIRLGTFLLSPQTVISANYKRHLICPHIFIAANFH